MCDSSLVAEGDVQGEGAAEGPTRGLGKGSSDQGLDQIRSNGNRCSMPECGIHFGDNSHRTLMLDQLTWFTSISRIFKKCISLSRYTWMVSLC